MSLATITQTSRATGRAGRFFPIPAAVLLRKLADEIELAGAFGDFAGDSRLRRLRTLE